MFKKMCLVVLLFICVNLAMGFALTTVTSIAVVSSTIDSTPIGATTPSTGVFTTVQFNTGLSNGAGFQRIIATAAGCTTAASTNAACTFSVSWPTSFNNTSYMAICAVDTVTAGGAIAVLSSGTKATGTISGQLQNIGSNASASTGTLDCIGIE